MKIVNRETFLALPPETVYQKYKPAFTEDLEIKLSNAGENDWVYTSADGLDIENNSSDQLFDRIDDMENGASYPLDLDNSKREGFFDEKQLFLIWEPDDVLALIHRLQKTLVPKVE